MGGGGSSARDAPNSRICRAACSPEGTSEEAGQGGRRRRHAGGIVARAERGRGIGGGGRGATVGVPAAHLLEAAVLKQAHAHITQSTTCSAAPIRRAMSEMTSDMVPIGRRAGRRPRRRPGRGGSAGRSSMLRVLSSSRLRLSSRCTHTSSRRSWTSGRSCCCEAAGDRLVGGREDGQGRLAALDEVGRPAFDSSVANSWQPFGWQTRRTTGDQSYRRPPAEGGQERSSRRRRRRPRPRAARPCRGPPSPQARRRGRPPSGPSCRGTARTVRKVGVCL